MSAVEEERDFDYICKWCGVELICAVESLSNRDPSVRAETWWHITTGRYTQECCNALGYLLEPRRYAEPTRWKEVG